MIDTKQRILTKYEREYFKKQLNIIESDVAGEIGGGIPNRHVAGSFYSKLSSEERRKLGSAQKKIVAILQSGTPGELSTHDKKQLESRQKVLEEALAKRMVPKSALKITQTDSSGSINGKFFEVAEQLAKVEMGKEFLDLGFEWKNIVRMLYPDDPQMVNIDRIRPE